MKSYYFNLPNVPLTLNQYYSRVVIIIATQSQF